jgi:hypothetical protein
MSLIETGAPFVAATLILNTKGPAGNAHARAVRFRSLNYTSPRPRED